MRSIEGEPLSLFTTLLQSHPLGFPVNSHWSSICSRCSVAASISRWLLLSGLCRIHQPGHQLPQHSIEKSQWIHSSTSLHMRNIPFILQIQDVYETIYDTCGRYWPYIHHYIFVGLILMQVTMIGLFGLKMKPAASVATFPLLFLTVIFNEYCKIRFLPTFVRYSIEVYIINTFWFYHFFICLASLYNHFFMMLAQQINFSGTERSGEWWSWWRKRSAWS